LVPNFWDPLASRLLRNTGISINFQNFVGSDTCETVRWLRSTFVHFHFACPDHLASTLGIRVNATTEKTGKNARVENMEMENALVLKNKGRENA